MRFDTVVISDLHLGALNSRANDLLRFLDFIRTPRLIIAGDLFEYPDLCRLRERDLRVLDALRIFARTGELVLLKGNHDPDIHYWRAVLGFTPCNEIEIDVGRRKYLVCHGDQWDSAMRLPAWVIRAADWAYVAAQKADPSHQIARILKKRCKYFTGAVKQLRQRAIAHARQRGVHGIIVGHTHVSCGGRTQGVHYLNSGCWTEKPAAFVGIRRGKAHRYYWDRICQRIDHAENENAAAPRMPAFGATA